MLKNTLSKYIFYDAKPASIPPTHVYRYVDHGLFSRMLRNVSIPVSAKNAILSENPAIRYVIGKLDCGRISTMEYLKYGEKIVRPELGPLDYGLVIEEARIGFFMGIPSLRNRSDIFERCKFGVIEPTFQ